MYILNYLTHVLYIACVNGNGLPIWMSRICSRVCSTHSRSTPLALTLTIYLPVCERCLFQSYIGACLSTLSHQFVFKLQSERADSKADFQYYYPIVALNLSDIRYCRFGMVNSMSYRCSKCAHNETRMLPVRRSCIWERSAQRSCSRALVAKKVSWIAQIRVWHHVDKVGNDDALTMNPTVTTVNTPYGRHLAWHDSEYVRSDSITFLPAGCWCTRVHVCV